MGNETFAILDTLGYIRPEHRTLCIGRAFGNAALLLASGSKGVRAALPNASIMTCPPRMNRCFGRVVDQMIRANELQSTTDTYLAMLENFTGRKKSDIRDITRRNTYWTTEKAIHFGLIDQVVLPTKTRALDLKTP